MAKLQGRSLRLYIGGTPTIIANEISSGVSVTNNLAECTNKDSGGFQEFQDGNKGWTMDVEAYFDYSDTNGIGELEDAMLAGTSITARLRDATDEVQKSGTVYVSNVQQTGQDGGTVTVSFTVTGTGALTKSTY